MLDFSSFKGILHSTSFEYCDKKADIVKLCDIFIERHFLRIRFQAMIFSLLKLNLLLQTIY